MACLEDYVDFPTVYEVPNHKLYFQHSILVQYENKTFPRNLSHTHRHTHTHTHTHMNINVLGQLLVWQTYLNVYFLLNVFLEILQ